MRIIQLFCFQTLVVAELMRSKVVPPPFVVWGRTLKLPYHECMLSRFEAAHPSLCAWPGWSELLTLLVPHFLI